MKQLKYFVALAEELHFQRAARRVSLTQPALSYQLKSLETELNVSLIERDRRNVNLTEAGQHFYSGAKRILKDMNALTRTTQEKDDARPLTLKVGYSESLNLSVAVNSIFSSPEKHPNITVDQRDMPTNDIFDAVKEGEIDIGLAASTETHSSLHCKPVVKGCWTLLMQDTHPLARGKSVSLTDIDKLPCLLFDQSKNPKLFEWWMDKFTKAGVRPNIVLQPKQIDAALRMVANGSALFIVASYAVKETPAGLTQLPFRFANNEITIGATWHQENESKALEYFLESLGD
ncbi:MAG: LysR family transcriptional regulator [Pseudomonadota bacterium]